MDHGQLALGHIDKQVYMRDEDGVDQSQDRDLTRSRWVCKNLVIGRSRTTEHALKSSRRHSGYATPSGSGNFILKTIDDRFVGLGLKTQQWQMDGQVAALQSLCQGEAKS